MMQATDLLGNPLAPGDTIAFSDRYAAVVGVVDEVRYVSRQDGKFRPIDPVFAERFNVVFRPLVSSNSFGTKKVADGEFGGHHNDIRDRPELRSNPRTVAVNEVHRIVKVA